MFLRKTDDAEKPVEFTCNICSATGDYLMYNPDSPLFLDMINNHVCYECAFWLNIIAHPIYGHEIIDGYYFIIHPYAKRPYHATGFSKGREYYIRKNDGTLLKTNNMECRGKIPERFRDQLPDTAIFLPLMSYQNLANFPFECFARGCWDRYNCLRYNLECEAEEGPFNEIPPSHEPGEEKCPSYAPRLFFKY